MKKVILWGIVGFVLLAFTGTMAEASSSLKLVEAKNVPGSFVGAQAVYADSGYIYLASYQGKLFVLGRNRSAHFPIVSTITVSSQPLVSVRGDSTYVYVTSGNGTLYMYKKNGKGGLSLVKKQTLSSYGLESLAVNSGSIFVSKGQAEMDVNSGSVFLSELNEGDTALAVNSSGSVTKEYGTTFEPNATVAYSRNTGSRLGAIANPLNLNGGNSQVAISATADRVILTTPGCCGQGVYIYNAGTLKQNRMISRAFANTAKVLPNSSNLVVGGEDGLVTLYGLSTQPSPLLAKIDLRQVTGHTGSEDIEIRGLWTDSSDRLIFAASSWGNDSSRGPNLPSFFVLEY